MERQLLPELKLRYRVIALAVLLVPVAFASRIGTAGQLLACVLPLMLTGTYRVSRIVGDKFDTRFHVAFMPLSHHKCNLRGVVDIHTTYQSQFGWWTLILFGPFQWLFGKVFDFLIPAIGGPYEIWLETAKGREILAWNGYNQRHFEQNVELLRTRTGAEVHVR
jgi:hypothetical protein